MPTALPRAADAPACDRSGLRSDHTPDACEGIGPFAMRLLWPSQPLDRPVPDGSPPIESRPTFEFLRFSMSANKCCSLRTTVLLYCPCIAADLAKSENVACNCQMVYPDYTAYDCLAMRITFQIDRQKKHSPFPPR